MSDDCLRVWDKVNALLIDEQPVDVETLLARTLSPRLSYVCNFCLLLMGVAIVVAIVIAVALTKFGLLSEYIEYILYYTLLYLVIL